MSIPIEIKESDHPDFVVLVENIINRLDILYPLNEVFVIRIKGWFDHKWLNFSGIGRVQFESSFLDHPQVAHEEFFQDQTTFPPFTPKRILSQESWVFKGEGPGPRLPHKYKFEPSAKNLNRRVKDHSKLSLFVWYSSETEKNKRGSILIYHTFAGEVDFWYLSFSYKNSWRLDKAKGVDRDFVLKKIIINTEPHA